MQGYRNPRNWISPTGLSPCAAMPTQSPPIKASDSGVSKTRSAPKRCCKPAVARKTPPLTPTSSPKTTTSGSSASTRASAKLIASTSVTSGIEVLDILALAGIGAWQSGVEMIKHRFRRTRTGRQIVLDGNRHFLLAFGSDFFLVRFAPIHSTDEIVSQPDDRLLLPALLDLFSRAITRRVIGGCGFTEPISDGLYQAWSFPCPNGSDRRIGCRAHSNDIVAIDLFSGKTCGDRFLRQRLRRGLQPERYRDRPLIVVDQKQDRQP